MAKIREAMAAERRGLIFANLVDFDMLYGHRKDVEGFARSLEEFDAMLGPLVESLAAGDLLLLTADHGCDPCPCSESTDHSREYVPILTYSREGKRGVDLGTRATLADMGQTVAENFGAAIPRGESFLGQL
jgi:phosphopentomutase